MLKKYCYLYVRCDAIRCALRVFLRHIYGILLGLEVCDKYCSLCEWQCESSLAGGLAVWGEGGAVNCALLCVSDSAEIYQAHARRARWSYGWNMWPFSSVVVVAAAVTSVVWMTINLGIGPFWLAPRCHI